MNQNSNLETLGNYLLRIPAINAPIGKGHFEDGNWWVKFNIDIDDVLAWRVVQELGHVLNSLSLGERLPAVFMPVSPPPYINGGPKYFLSWVIESKDTEFTPSRCIEWLEGRLPRPVGRFGAVATGRLISMKLEIKSINPTEFAPLPEEAEGFVLPIEVEVGEQGQPGSELFHFVAASASGLQHQVRGQDFQILRGIILMERFDIGIVRRAIQNLLNHASSKQNWDEVIEMLSRYSRYDSEDL